MCVFPKNIHVTLSFFVILCYSISCLIIHSKYFPVSNWVKPHCHIEPMTSMTSYWTVILNRWPRKPGDEVELFWLFEQNGGTVGRTLYSFHGEILSKNIARTARSQLDGHLLFGVYLQTWADFCLLNFPKKMRYRCELNIDQGKYFLACF